MGFSYRVEAGHTMDKWTAACIKSTGSQNTWEENGETYFFEHTRRDKPDGAITGSIYRFLPDGIHCRKTGSFRIEGDGMVTRAPKFLMKVS